MCGLLMWSLMWTLVHQNLTKQFISPWAGEGWSCPRSLASSWPFVLKLTSDNQGNLVSLPLKAWLKAMEIRSIACPRELWVNSSALIFPQVFSLSPFGHNPCHCWQLQLSILAEKICRNKLLVHPLLLDWHDFPAMFSVFSPSTWCLQVSALSHVGYRLRTCNNYNFLLPFLLSLSV